MTLVKAVKVDGEKAKAKVRNSFSKNLRTKW